LLLYPSVSRHTLSLFFSRTAPPPNLSPLPLHDALPISQEGGARERSDERHPRLRGDRLHRVGRGRTHLADERKHAVLVDQALGRSEEHTSELQSLTNLVCRLLLEKKKQTSNKYRRSHQH